MNICLSAPIVFSVLRLIPEITQVALKTHKKELMASARLRKKTVFLLPPFALQL